jgi:hypothetical protein
MSRDYNKSLLLHADENRANFLNKMVEFRIQYNEDKTNDYFLFLYLASILNYIEAHNGGCLSEVGMMSLKVNIAGTLSKLIEKDENNKIDQQELVRFCLNLLNSYTVCILTKGMFEIAKENDAFFNAYEFPDTIRSEFDELDKTITDLLPTLKSLLDTYTIYMDAEHKKIFNLQKNNGFYKQIFNASSCKIGGMKGVENAIECR